MNRRAFLAASATGSLAAVSGCLGLLGSSSSVNHVGNLDAEFHANTSLPADEDPADGYPPEYGNPDERSVDPSSFPTTTTNGETVGLAPIEVARYWHQRAAARFVDARGLQQYERAHIYGAVSSPAQRGSEGGSIGGWSKDDRIVCYCGCPHHLSSIRASALQQAGFSNVFVIDEGFGPWYEGGDPMRGTDFSAPQEAFVDGEVDPQYAGKYAWATHEASGQQEAAPIADDGTFNLHLKFYDVTADTPIHVQTPAFDVTRPLGDLTGAVLTG
ncbi:rhodanese-like domain-containing protein [Halobacterium noricense]|uniref:rhodanese-like domain-containing protein n=1 Tax=Halobacterium noricense TaxID=223182 RepID=UPI001E54FF48|nr:rhodanese-like domain-containing protein [Halobacterium noricense]UHH24726.1 rhodanese-like domain-containing protein [Halobacterium noricense]